MSTAMPRDVRVERDQRGEHVRLSVQPADEFALPQNGHVGGAAFHRHSLDAHKRDDPGCRHWRTRDAHEEFGHAARLETGVAQMVGILPVHEKPRERSPSEEALRSERGETPRSRMLRRRRRLAPRATRFQAAQREVARRVTLAFPLFVDPVEDVQCSVSTTTSEQLVS